MSEEEKLQLENKCLMKYSKAQMIQKYIDELEESSKLSELWCKSQEENRKLKEVIDKAIDLVEKLIKEYKLNYGDEPSKMLLVYETLLNTLKEVE